MQRGTHNAICAFSDHVQDLVVVGHVERQGSTSEGFGLLTGLVGILLKLGQCRKTEQRITGHQVTVGLLERLGKTRQMRYATSLSFESCLQRWGAAL